MLSTVNLHPYTKVLAVRGGVVDIHGTPATSWTRLAATAEEGATTITLDPPVTNWKVGMRNRQLIGR